MAVVCFGYVAELTSRSTLGRKTPSRKLRQLLKIVMMTLFVHFTTWVCLAFLLTQSFGNGLGSSTCGNYTFFVGSIQFSSINKPTTPGRNNKTSKMFRFKEFLSFDVAVFVGFTISQCFRLDLNVEETNKNIFVKADASVH